MAITVLRVYDNLVAAEQARIELLRCGFCRDSVHLTTKDDEAGAVQGNFILPAKDRSSRKERGFFGNLFGRPRSRRESDSHARRNHSQEVVRCNIYLLVVDAGDNAQYDRAADIMHRYGAFDVEQRAANRPDSW